MPNSDCKRLASTRMTWDFRVVQSLKQLIQRRRWNVVLRGTVSRLFYAKDSLSLLKAIYGPLLVFVFTALLGSERSVLAEVVWAKLTEKFIVQSRRKLGVIRDLHMKDAGYSYTANGYVIALIEKFVRAFWLSKKTRSVPIHLIGAFYSLSECDS